MCLDDCVIVANINIWFTFYSDFNLSLLILSPTEKYFRLPLHYDYIFLKIGVHQVVDFSLFAYCIPLNLCHSKESVP